MRSSFSSTVASKTTFPLRKLFEEVFDGCCKKVLEGCRIRLCPKSGAIECPWVQSRCFLHLRVFNHPVSGFSNFFKNHHSSDNDMCAQMFP